MRLSYTNLNPRGGDSPYIRIIGMSIIFLGVVIGDVVFLSLGVVQVKSIKKK